jgi:hypothetical protein
MQKFDYRAPRFAVDFPVKLKMLSSLHIARCRDISEDGMRLELGDPFPPESCGEVSFSYQELSLDLYVRVTHAGVGCDGLKFLYESDEQRAKMLLLMSRLATPHPVASLFLVTQQLY